MRLPTQFTCRLVLALFVSACVGTPQPEPPSVACVQTDAGGCPEAGAIRGLDLSRIHPAQPPEARDPQDHSRYYQAQAGAAPAGSILRVVALDRDVPDQHVMVSDDGSFAFEVPVEAGDRLRILLQDSQGATSTIDVRIGADHVLMPIN